MDFYNFYTGKEFEAYQYLGAHVWDGGTTFRTFAPAAQRVSVIGEFNGWTETPMNRVHDGNFWECTMNNVGSDLMYKYRIYRQDGSFVDHADPYAFYSEMRPGTASKTYALGGYEFGDSKWLKNRKASYDKPVNIYEMHFGSWKKRGEGQEDWYTYEELAPILITYLKEHGYNYVEIMPLCEYPCDESWGYQDTGYFSPTSRYGKPEELKAFVDQCHQAGIGVILDFVPVHFAVNDYALAEYDGTALYEYPNMAVGRNEWGSCNFMHSRGEVCSFLQSSAYYWMNEFHFDGLRMDAVGNLIYWQGDASRGENLAALKFIRTMNQGLKERIPDCLLFAEDSTPYQGVTKPVWEGGLGFDYKWDLGWMHDTLSYFQADAKERQEKYHKLTFSMMYFYNERYILPLSHDEVVHGKATIAQKMNGGYDGKFPQARAFYMYMYAHPGAKLNFMGNELAQLKEWCEKDELDWILLKFPVHEAFHKFMADLNQCYLKNSAFSQRDFSQDGFSWVDCHQEQKCMYLFERISGDQKILAVFNFSDEIQEYTLEKDYAGYELLLASDMVKYGGKKRYILPLSHDEVVHGKATIAQKMNGGYDGKFPQARAFYMYMYAHPGAKLNFMGNELAQLKEWCEKDELDWILLKFPVHEAFHKFMADLNQCYLKNSAFSQRDFSQDGFSWVDCHQEQKCMYLFERISGDQKILAVFNFSDEIQEYTLEKDYAGYELLLASDMVKYGGKKRYTKKEKVITGGKAVFKMGPFSARYYLVK